jgi:peptidoglycan/LPS O-acetylase OafA/YrhL
MKRVPKKRVSTAAEILVANKGVGPGFDALRLLLSLWIFTLHAMFICRGAEVAEEYAANPIHRIIISPALPMFFVVSGYLVTGSAIRTKNISTFILFRVFRIAPALLVEVTLSAMILGPWLTEKTLPEYFSDPLFFKYFLNILGSVHLFLPGLFVTNPVTAVNINLWTLKPEFYCYTFLSIMILSRVIFSRIRFSCVGSFVLVATIFYTIRGGYLYNYLAVADWKMLIVAFVLGSLAYHWNDRIPVSGLYAATAALIVCVALAYPPLIIVGLVGLTYIVVYIGMCRIYIPNILRKGDYSYGVYLFGFQSNRHWSTFWRPNTGMVSSFSCWACR